MPYPEAKKIFINDKTRQDLFPAAFYRIPLPLFIFPVFIPLRSLLYFHSRRRQWRPDIFFVRSSFSHNND